MKKTNNNRFRSGSSNNHSSQIYSLNYRFDSNSIAGKYSGTALELIKRYNELARDSMNNSDIVNAEIFRQYAEHYRKIVTDINEKKALNNTNRNQRTTETVDSTEPTEVQAVEPQRVSQENVETLSVDTETKEQKISSRKKEFKVIEIKEEKAETPKKTRTRRVSKKVEEAAAEAV